MERMSPRLQFLVRRGEAVEAAQVVGPRVAREILDEPPGALDVLEESPRDGAGAQPAAARLRHDRVELGRARRIDDVLDRHHHRSFLHFDFACAPTVSDVSTGLQEMPATDIAGAAIHASGAKATAAMQEAWTAEAKSVSGSRFERLRSRGSCVAAMIAPTPIEDSSSVYVPGPS